MTWCRGGGGGGGGLRDKHAMYVPDDRVGYNKYNMNQNYNNTDQYIEFLEVYGLQAYQTGSRVAIFWHLNM